MKTFLIILIFLISFSSVAYSQQYYTISPGRGIDGVINLGVDMVRVFERWGVSDTVNEGYGVLVYDYYKYQLSFATDIYTNKVAIIYIYTYIYKTDTNIGIGSSLDEVLSVYGSRYRLQQQTSMGGYAIFYDSGGIGFGLDDNKVVSIAVYYSQ